MGTIVTLIPLVIAVMLIYFKNDIIGDNTSLNKVIRTSGFVVCVIALAVLYIINI